MADVSPFVTGGGTAGLIVATAYAAQQAIGYWRDRRTNRRADGTVQVTDAATANAVLVQTLEAVWSENRRLVDRVASLEDENERREQKITDLEARLAAIATELAELRTTVPR